MALEELEQLQKMIVDAAGKPVWGGMFTNVGSPAKVSRYGASTADIETWIAFRETDRETLRARHPGGWPSDRQYRADSLPERISQAFSDLGYGEDPTFTAPGGDEKTEKEGPDQENLDALVEANNLPSELRRMANDCSAEGEQWWRIYTNPDESEYPILEFNSRLDVIPLFRGRKILAAAFVTVLFSQDIEIKDQIETEYWRLIEIQTDGMTRNLLFRGGNTSLGSAQPLSARTETANMMEDWNHGLDIMLAGRIPNKLGRDFRLGVSDYQGIRDQLFDLNEARTIMAENARVAAKKRAVAKRRLVGQDGKVDLGSDILIADEGDGVDRELGGTNVQSNELTILEYTFDATALIEHTQELVATAVTRVGLVEQFVNTGRGSTDGGGNGNSSGVELKTRLIPTTLAASGKFRYQDDEIPKILVAMQRVDALDVQSGGCGHQWTSPEEPPAFERSSILPEDDGEAVRRHVEAVSGEIESIFTAVKDRNPDWKEEEVQAEVDRIREDRGTFGGNHAGSDQQGSAGDITPPELTPAQIAAGMGGTSVE